MESRISVLAATAPAPHVITVWSEAEAACWFVLARRCRRRAIERPAEIHLHFHGVSEEEVAAIIHRKAK